MHKKMPLSTNPPLHHNVVHFRQRFRWDCGLSCILMALSRPLRERFLAEFDAVCDEDGFKKSTWTIDLCYVLRRYGMSHIYYTRTIGVRRGYKGQPYYDRILPKDEDRVVQKFQLAESYGIQVECRSLEMPKLISHLERCGPIIILIDASLITCDICKLNKLSIELRSCLPWRSQYIGHYIILCAHDPLNKKIVYRNPGMKSRLCVISYDALDIARKSFGTDEDVILIFNSNPL